MQNKIHVNINIVQLKRNCRACAVDAKWSMPDAMSVAVSWSDMRFSC
jgi:hypothetical protein